MKRSKLRLVSVIFALILVVSIVYAVGGGQFDITGTASLGSVKLGIGDIGDEIAGTGIIGAGSGTMTITAANNASIEAAFEQPGDSVTFSFNITSSGQYDAEITDVVITAKNSAEQSVLNSVVEITVSAKEGDTVSASTPLLCTITVAWKTGANPDVGGDISFTITISYAQKTN